MNTSWYIAKQISQGSKKSFSRFIVKIAIFSTSLSVATMVVAICMASGFTKEIREKVFGFWGHIHIESFQNNDSYENSPITEDAKLLKSIFSVQEVRTAAPYINKAGIIKTKNAMEGIILKGVNYKYDWNFIQSYITEGRVPNFQKDSTSREILISTSTAKRVAVNVGDPLIIYFLAKDGGRPIGRKFEVVGLYHTGLEEYDTRFALGDAKILQDINNWTDNLYSGYEIKIKDIGQLKNVTQIIYDDLPAQYNATNIRDTQTNIFDWLELLVKNEIFVLILMLIVALLNMTTALMILILDRTKMIGVLKAIGATQAQIKKIFIYNAMIILGYGLAIGNTIALVICWLQSTFKIIKLDESAYYFKEVPVLFEWWSIIGINLLTIIITLFILLLPAMIISKVSPLKAIRYD
ncbi:MAG: FtsX-like permease family protein [Chitinophagales bacterium]|nr:FtsX-like permease family protein [Chitinophagales bacterium]